MMPFLTNAPVKEFFGRVMRVPFPFVGGSKTYHEKLRFG